MTDKQPVRTTPPKGAKCCATVFSKRVSRTGSSRGYPCKKSAVVVVEGGKTFCAIHDPQAEARRKQAFMDRLEMDSRARERQAMNRRRLQRPPARPHHTQCRGDCKGGSRQNRPDLYLA